MKKKFTLIELIIVIIVIGILAAMSLPKFTNVVRDARTSAMIHDEETLEKMMILYYQKYDKLPLLNEDQNLIVLNNDISLVKLVQAEEIVSEDMKTIYKSLQETLNYYGDSEENLYRIDVNEINKSLLKKLKYGTKKEEKDFFVYSTKTNNVYYYNTMLNGSGEIQHSEFNTKLKTSELVDKKESIVLKDIEIKKPILELTTDLSFILENEEISWEYIFKDNNINTTPFGISFILNDIEYDSIDKIPTNLNSGEYTLKFKAKNSKNIWSDEVIETFKVIEKPILELKTDLSFVLDNKDISWEYIFKDSNVDTTPYNISFILNDIEYDGIDKIPVRLKVGEYTLKFKAKNSKNIWSNEIVKTFKVGKASSIGGMQVPVGTVATANRSTGISTPDRAIDGDIGTPWNSGTTSGILTLTFPTSTFVSKIQVAPDSSPDCTHSYKIKGLKNGNWIDIGSANIPVHHHSFIYTPIKLKEDYYDALKLEINSGNSWTAIHEISIYAD